MGVLLSHALPGELTAMRYITFSLDAASSGLIDGGTMALNVVSCLLPALLGLGVILTNLSRKGYVRSLILSVCLLLVYLFLGAVFGTLESSGYEEPLKMIACKRLFTCCFCVLGIGNSACF